MIADEFELERLRAELAQEKQMKQMLDSSVAELHQTVEELESRVDNMDEESNEWKTRYETQAELNQQLAKQSIVLHDKVEEAKRSLKDSRMPKTSRIGEDTSEANPTFVRQLEREKNALESQLRDLEWRLDQESKAYHKANEERKQYILEINAAKGVLEHMRNRQKDQLQMEMGNTPRGNNIAEDQRILDPRKGPIKKTAAVKNLPSLNNY